MNNRISPIVLWIIGAFFIVAALILAGCAPAARHETTNGTWIVSADKAEVILESGPVESQVYAVLKFPNGESTRVLLHEENGGIYNAGHTCVSDLINPKKFRCEFFANGTWVDLEVWVEKEEK